MAQALQALAAAGVAVWLDDLSRSRIQSGSLIRPVEQGAIVGLAADPTIFAKAIASGLGCEEQMRALALRGTAVGEALQLMTAWDVRAARNVLRSVHNRTGGRDGRASIEVDPRISGDAERTAAEARGLWWLVDRPNLFIKIPATLAGLPAVTAALADGISVSATLIFSLERYQAMPGTFLSGLEQRAAAGSDLGGIESVASFFVSRVDTEADRRVGELAARGDEGDHAAAAGRLRGQVAIANARLAHEVYERMLASPRRQALAARGARPQRRLWASTGVKNKSLDDARYVVEAVAPDTVNTMPEATLRAVADHGEVRGGYAAARAVLDDLRRVGVVYGRRGRHPGGAGHRVLRPELAPRAGAQSWRPELAPRAGTS